MSQRDRNWELRNFKDLVVWDKAHKLTVDLYRVTRAFSKEELYGLTSQIRRSACSIGANLAEGCGRRSDGEFGRFLLIAMGSASELSYDLLLARDLKLLVERGFASLDDELEEVRRMLNALSVKVRAAAG